MRVVAKMTSIDSSSCSETPLPHKARSFGYLPSPSSAASLLAELATAPCLYSPVLADMPLAFYGAGNMGRFARDFLKTVGHDFVMAIDRNAQQLAKEPCWSGVRLLHPDDVPERDKRGLRLAISIVTAPYVPLERLLREQGFADVVPFYDLAESFRAVHPLSNGWFADPLTSLDRAKTAEVLARWDDHASRAHHLQFLAWRRLREEWTFEGAPVSTGDRFFIPEVAAALHGQEFLLDAGAHHGSVVETFLTQTKGAFRQIAAVEPDPGNQAVLKGKLRALLQHDARVAVYDCALADRDGEALFHEGIGYASQLSPTGEKTVTTCRLDSLGVSPTFIKLHLEGAELAALRGARQTLIECRPIVAATVYHNNDGIFRTALWLMETLPHYSFLFRLHSWCGTGAVIYAIPDERIGRT
jgi:FkbM family methyltransferase